MADQARRDAGSPASGSLGGLAALVREHTPSPPPSHADERARELFVARLAPAAARSAYVAQRAKPHLPRLWWQRARLWMVELLAAEPRHPWRWSAIAVVAASAVAVTIWALWPAPSLRYEVSGATLQPGGYVVAENTARVSFSDGSVFTFSKGSSGRVLETTPNGARILVESGGLDAAVVHRDETHFAVEAGPFLVQVTGTRFDVAWDPRAQVLSLALTEGSVRLVGPLAPDGLAVSAGHRVVADLKAETLRLDPIDATAAAPSPPSAHLPTAKLSGPSAESPHAAPAGAETTSEANPEIVAPPTNSQASKVSPPSAHMKSWADRVAEGDHKGVLEAAEAAGIAASIASVGIEDLVALGDAARYNGRGDVANQVLLALRKRFPGTPAASAAAFLLGRAAHDGGAASSAIGWFDAYLAEAPGGSFAAEALGRKMLAVRAVSGEEAARALATVYLRAYPRGAHASIAKSLVSE